MKLHAAVTQYIAYKHSLGMKFVSDGRVLKSFARLHGNKDLKAIGTEPVMAFLDGKGPLTSFWHRKHCALSGFYRFAIARRYTGSVPLPRRLPKLPHHFVPHIYSHGELKRLMEAIPLALRTTAVVSMSRLIEPCCCCCTVRRCASAKQCL